jgi:putative ABC transport system ATP-binding protein
LSTSTLPIIQLIDVTKIYRSGRIDYPAVKGVNLKIWRGDLVAITGPSGSGKSTLLNLIGALERPTSGSVIIDGLDLTRLSDEKLAILRNRKIGHIFQSYNLIQRLTALENVEMPLVARLLKLKTRKDRSLEALGAVGPLQYANRRPGELSGGEQQCASIARSLVGQPAIILADEPTGNLDSKTTQEIVRQIVQLNEVFGTTVIVATHNLPLAQLTHRIITLKDGFIESDRENAKTISNKETRLLTPNKLIA